MIDEEILEGFKEETKELLSELMGLVEQIEDSGETFPKDELEKFAQIIDRVMGTVNTMSQMDPENQGFSAIGKLSGLCKALGYKAAESNCAPIVPLFAAFWADTVDIIGEISENLTNQEKVKEILSDFSPVLQKRLEWLGKKVMDLSKSKEGEGQSQIQVDALLKSFGI